MKNGWAVRKQVSRVEEELLFCENFVQDAYVSNASSYDTLMQESSVAFDRVSDEDDGRDSLADL